MSRARSLSRGWLLALVACVAVVLIGGSPALADGPCGVDPSGPTACHITGSGDYNGELTVARGGGLVPEQDYYVFYAKRDSRVTLTITDDENPNCAETGGDLYICGGVNLGLRNARGNDIPTHPTNGGVSTIRDINNAPVANDTSSSFFLPRAGTFYVVVSGGLEQDESAGTATPQIPVPYTLTVAATPNVTYPAPPRKHHRHHHHRR